MLIQKLGEGIGGFIQNALTLLSILLSITVSRVQLHSHHVPNFADQFFKSVVVCNVQSAAPEHHSKQDGTRDHRLVKHLHGGFTDVE